MPDEPKPATGEEPKPKEDPKPATGSPEAPKLPDKLPDDHPAALALAKANKEAETWRKKVKEYEDASKSDLEKAQSKAAEAEYRAQEAETRYLRLEVASEKGLTAAQARRLQGSTREELEKDADELLKEFGGGEKGTKPPARKPAERLKGGSDPESSPDPDPDEIVKKIRRY